jgi:D-threo-aldose 1-dehydrogenase
MLETVPDPGAAGKHFSPVVVEGDHMVELATRSLGSTGLEVTSLCVGTSPIGSMPRLYGYDVDTDEAVATVLAAFDSPINFLDTSNGYGDGTSERRIGQAIAARGGLPDGYVLATKIDPAPGTTDFSAARVRQSFEESLERLGLDRLQLLYLHDPERISFEEGVAPGGPVEAMLALKEEGLVDNLGVAGGPIDVMTQYVETGAFGVALSHNRFTLLDRSAESLMERTAELGVAFVNAAPYGGGMLVKGPDVQTQYAYGSGSDVARERAFAMKEACDRHGVPLAAAALQFSMRDPRVVSTVAGVSHPDRIAQTLALASAPIPSELWAELEALTPPASVWIG